MIPGNVIFYGLSAIIIVFSLLAVTSRKLLRAAIYLLFVLVAIAAIYFILDYMFLAAVQIVVYMGGVLVLIIFSILLTSHLAERLPVAPKWTIALSGLAAVIGAGTVTYILFNSDFIASKGAEAGYDVAAIGQSLLSTEKFGYVLPFEVISILLLAALIGAIIVAKRPRNVKTESND